MLDFLKILLSDSPNYCLIVNGDKCYLVTVACDFSNCSVKGYLNVLVSVASRN